MNSLYDFRTSINELFQFCPLPLIDNASGDSYSYEVHVYTGAKKHAGTESNVYMEVLGDADETGERRLEDGVRKVDIFAFYSKISRRYTVVGGKFPAGNLICY